MHTPVVALQASKEANLAADKTIIGQTNAHTRVSRPGVVDAKNIALGTGVE
jgi:hypothetical protein